jgi:hypothetical protein
MTTLLLDRPEVHSSPEFADDCEPFISPEDTFQPSPADEAWLVAFNAADSGEPADFPSGVPLADRERIYMAHLSGDRAGKRAREAREAREVGRTMGLARSASEPPAGYAPHEAAAYREGYAEGLRAADELDAEDARLEAWVAANEGEAMEEYFATILHDADIYPLGCVS